MPTLYRKTAKGQAEIETRAHRLAPRLRGLLILVDGKRDDAALAALMPQQTAALLDELTAQGFVEARLLPDAVAAPPPAPLQPASAPSGPAPVPADFVALRRAAVRALTDELGPAAETVAMRMEKARSAEELRPLLIQAAQAVANIRGRAAGEAYAARFPGA